MTGLNIKIKFIVHNDCDMEVVGIIISTIKHNIGLDCTVYKFGDFIRIYKEDNNNSNVSQNILIIIGNSFDDTYQMMIHDAVISDNKVILRCGIMIGGVEKPLCEYTAFKIVTLNSVDMVCTQIKEIMIAAS